MNAVQFQTTPENAPDPIASSKRSGPIWADHTLKPEYRDRVAKLPGGVTWVRFLPAIKGSSFKWMMALEQIQDASGRFPKFTDPKTVGQPSVFEEARLWFRKNKPEALANKDTNPGGLRLYSKKRGIAWMVNEGQPEGSRLQLLEASLYGAEWGGSTGLAFRLFEMTEEVDNEPGSPTAGKKVHGDVTDINAGKLIKIEKTAGNSKADFASYNVGVGKADHALNMQLLTAEEMDMIKPLEELVYIPSREEQIGYLTALIGADTVKQIFG